MEIEPIKLCERCWSSFDCGIRDPKGGNNTISIPSCENCSLFRDDSDSITTLMVNNLSSISLFHFPKLIKRLWNRIQRCEVSDGN